MSKNSHKQMYEQLMAWMPTVVKQRKKRVKSNNKRTGNRQNW